MKGVTSVSYSFKVNGRIVGKVLPSRGLRQGDPMSLYLFILCSQGLSTILNYNVTQRTLQGIRIAIGNPAITHLFFADDNLIFFKANKQNCNTIKDCLKTYEMASGTLINYDKSAITFSKIPPITTFITSKRVSSSQYAKVTTFILAPNLFNLKQEDSVWLHSGQSSYILFPYSNHHFKGD